MRRFFDVFLFEDVPAIDRRPNELWLDEVERCDIYVGLFGQLYGSEDEEGISPTEREFDRATALGKHSLIFLKAGGRDGRQPKMANLIQKAVLPRSLPGASPARGPTRLDHASCSPPRSLVPSTSCALPPAHEWSPLPRSLPIRTTSVRKTGCLPAANLQPSPTSPIAVNGGKTQPVPFTPGEELRLKDAEGQERVIRVVDIRGRPALVEYRVPEPGE